MAKIAAFIASLGFFGIPCYIYRPDPSGHFHSFYRPSDPAGLFHGEPICWLQF
jgi:hypothetical protein